MLKDDSRKIKKGDIFIARSGVNTDGHKYIKEAIKNGAKKVVAEHGKYSVDTLIVDNTNEYLDKYLKINNVDIKIIGVTGTNGKTTTCYLIYQLLNKLNVKTSYIGTLGYIIDDKIKHLDNTTPGKLELYNLLLHSKKNNVEYVVMEISSQALQQNRVNFIELDYIIFTNISRDHLDYHKTMDNYINSKRKIFELAKDNTITLVNNDDKYKESFMINKYKTYGFNNSDYTINSDNIVNNNKYDIPLLGKFNKYNVLASISLMYELGYKYEQLYPLVKDLKEPSGRMEVIEYNTNKIIIDYAHTPDALENIINTVKGLKHNKIITIIGCGGNRDKGKRKIMGSISTEMSDYVIFTSDNPRFEDAISIINDMICELDKNNYEIESNREIAIKKGIHLLDTFDILLVLGKGHEKYQIIKDEKIPFDDKLTVIEYIR